MQRRASKRSSTLSLATTSTSAMAACLRFPSTYQALELRHDLEQIADQADVRDLENRRLAVLVDRDDRTRILDAGQVLDRAGDAQRHIQLRSDDLAGLADLKLVG